jgi:hypothetical protein
VRVEGDDLGIGCAQLVDVVGGDGANRAEVRAERGAMEWKIGRNGCV